MEKIIVELKKVEYKKSADGKEFAVLFCYINFGCVQKIFCSKDKALKLYELCNKNNNFDITQFVHISWNDKTNTLFYSIEI